MNSRQTTKIVEEMYRKSGLYDLGNNRAEQHWGSARINFIYILPKA